MDHIAEGLSRLAQIHKTARSSKSSKDLKAMIKIALDNHLEIDEIVAHTRMPRNFVERIANDRRR